MSETKGTLLGHLLEGPATAGELAQVADISTTAARRHMEDLVEEGAVEAFFRQRGVGRPSKLYRVTDEGRERFPRRYDLAAEQLIQALLEEDGEPALAETMEAAARDLAGSYRDRIPAQAPLEERVQALEGVLEELGFPTEIEVHDDRLVIVRRDCIFLKLAREHRDAVCGDLDTTLLEELLGVDVELEGCLPDGRSSCRHVVQRLEP